MSAKVLHASDGKCQSWGAQRAVGREAEQAIQGLRAEATRRFVDNYTRSYARCCKDDTHRTKESLAQGRREVVNEHRLSATLAAVDNYVEEPCV